MSQGGSQIFTFLVTDVISEVYGKRTAGHVVLGGFLALLSVLALVRLGLVWPAAPFWEQGDAFQAILGSTSRIIIASFCAYVLSQLHDVWAFHFWKAVTKGRYLWLRNNLSTASSQFIDSFVFIFIAFYGVLPIWPLILGQWVIKCAIAVLDTPFVYILVHLLQADRAKTPGASGGSGSLADAV